MLPFLQVSFPHTWFSSPLNNVFDGFHKRPDHLLDWFPVLSVWPAGPIWFSITLVRLNHMLDLGSPCQDVCVVLQVSLDSGKRKEISGKSISHPINHSVAFLLFSRSLLL